MSIRCVPIYSSQSDASVIAYICNLKSKPGALNLEKCVEHNVPPGPLLGLLKNGIDITLDNGKIVKAKDVCDPNEKPMSFIFLDIPSEEFLTSLQTQFEVFKNFATEDDRDIALIVHFSPANITNNNCYRVFVEKLTNTAEHIYLNSSDNEFSGYVAAHRIQYQLNQINAKVFPLLAEAEIVPSQGSSISSQLKKTKLGECVETEEAKPKSHVNKPNVTSMTTYHLRPRKSKSAI